MICIEYLLPKIKVETGLFSNTNSFLENGMSSYFGISGVSINCIANYDSSRVELYIAKPNKNEIKKMHR